MLQTLPAAAERYARAQRNEIAAAVSAVGRLWRRVSAADLDASWLAIAPQLMAVADTAQERVATGVLDYIPSVLAETGQRVRELDYALDPWLLVGTAGDGRPTATLMQGAVVRTKEAIGAGWTPPAALHSGGQWLTGALSTVLSDTGRTMEKMAGHSRHVTGYVRMLAPPSCGRCVILAGKRSRAQASFKRHPLCDCRNIPASESVAGDLLVDPEAYLDSLDDEALRKVLGSQANAQAWRDGADTSRLINAYRRTGGIQPAQLYSGRIRYATTAGTTRRSPASYQMRQQADMFRPEGERYFRTREPRLMPESIYATASDRAEAIDLLRLHGWIT